MIADRKLDPHSLNNLLTDVKRTERFAARRTVIVVGTIMLLACLTFVLFTASLLKEARVAERQASIARQQAHIAQQNATLAASQRDRARELSDRIRQTSGIIAVSGDRSKYISSTGFLVITKDDTSTTRITDQPIMAAQLDFSGQRMW